MAIESAALIRAQRLDAETAAVLGEVIPIVSDGVNVDPMSVFGMATTVRSDGKDPGLAARQEMALRLGAARFGIDSPFPVLPSQLEPVEDGESYHVMSTGGKLRGKLEAQVETLNNDQQPDVDDEGRPTGPLSYWFFGSNKRPLTGDADEKTAAAEHGFGPDATEIDAADLVASTLRGFVPLDRPHPLPFDYDYRRGHEVSSERSGRLRLLGHVVVDEQDKRPVLSLAAEGDLTIKDGRANITGAPEVPDLTRLADAALRSEAVRAEAGIDPKYAATRAVLMESPTFRRSRELGMAVMALRTGRRLDVATYSTDTFAQVKGRQPQPVATNVLWGEFHKIAQWHRELRRELARQQS